MEAESTKFLAAHADIRDAQGREMIVLHGHLPEPTVQTGIGGVSARAPRVRDRRNISTADWIPFTSKILPRYFLRSQSLEELLPWLYLKGIPTGDFSEAPHLLVVSPAGLFPATICRLKAGW